MTTSTTPVFPAGSVLGYPRIGPRRELKKAIEAFWAGRSSADEVEAVAADLRRRTRNRLVELGLPKDSPAIPSAFSFYDHVLDATAVVGAVPARFADLVDAQGRLDLAGYSTVARGRGDDLPLEMTKWFDTNYHYLVPEIGPETAFRYASTRPVAEFTEALSEGVLTRPVIVGPVTYLALAKATDGAGEGFLPIDRLADILPVYVALLRDLAAAGATWVQLEEPALVSDSIDVPADRLLAAVTEAYRVLATELTAPERPAIFVAAPYGDLGAALPVLAATDVEAIGIDLVRGDVPTAAVPGLETKTLVAGVIDGHNIWRADLDAKLAILEQLENLGAAAVAVGTSTSLFHVPHDTADEPQLDPTLVSWLAFADQKVTEVVTLAEGLTEGREAIHEQLLAASDAVRTRATAPGVVRPEVRDRVAALDEDAFHRGEFAARKAAQAARLNLPPLPTTTIGSFPQTPEIRKARAAFGKGELTAEQYEDEMKAEIRRVVELQEKIGIDVLVHGEPERNDMVQYFAENLDGFAVTANGWVQSYGSRCTRPSILWGDVSRPAPITVAWSEYTQSLTQKPVKGMLTGPVTILAWSFVRDDQPLGATANQVALALRDEIADLEDAGIAIVQVDEPALRELLPLREADQAAYLDWSVRSFRLSTAGVREDTQIHTHLCYSEFGEIIDAIDGLDADVTSIEAARSKMEILGDIHAAGYPRAVGPGVYDIHSPRVPSETEITELLTAAVKAIDVDQLWVNPDCGLKTRRYEEVTPSLERIQAATLAVRATL
ncbi:5-methyltetrahydropteroyltriglutamate--homocysteine S-methyltransferase [Cellulomonas soli]|uniref:5-methyltetrahydropteroyltriglutamate--homocysteine methyltransferase n=1 Tax=Cellulomonas soli TaxID=931535 RepID=A0A512PCQ0_9CELL|nr:5-methyltetrahydropteroyltriglutamate--homocysteine S-methyltransferase [Cellulomonas soli]NYI58568.1 5-methyltetrahydropteroyltriglutamate--homocysteine methyltransferase [Cellulomonas soli]GEP68993.1 5-methyltetrahydropteroyltriglutamate--homocysteine methyltransferase [Cellulomonas soli]